MILYWFLLLFISVFAYGMGSISTMVLASNYVFKSNIKRLGKGNRWFSNFRRIYGVMGFIKLLLTELIKDIIPILLGGLILGFKGHADVGRMFAALCVVLGRLYPLFSDFRGCHATVAVALMGMFAAPSAGIAAAVVGLAISLLTRYLSLGAIAAAIVMAAVSVLVVDDALIRNLVYIAAGLVFFRHIPAISRLLNQREERLSFEKDIMYKLDEKF